MKLDDREWEVFTLEDIFDILPGKRLEKRNMIAGDRPFIGASDSNNGLTACCGNVNESLDKNVLGINYNGSVCEAFYHAYECIFSDDVKRFHLKHHEDNKLVLLFMGVVIRQQKVKYQYAYKFNEQRMRRQVIMLPVTDEGQPDYQFMGDYIRELTMEKKKQYRRYVELRIAELCAVPESQMAADWKLLIGSHDWKPFYVVSIFPENERGKRLKKADHVQGNVPYASSTADNNGIDGFIEASEGARVFNDCISLANSGSVGSAFYEPFAFVASDHVTHLKKEGMSKYQYLFLTCLLEQQSGNFNFNREINDARLNKMQIMLPVTDDGQPDYDFMERFGRKMMSNKYKQYLAFLAKL